MNIKPKKLFLIDAIGAFISAIMLGLVLPYYQEFIGMPASVLHGLSFVSIGLMCFSLSCFLLVKKNYRPFLFTIATLNLCYCVISILLVLGYYQELTLLGLLYFIIEKIIVITLVTAEFKTAMNYEMD